MTRPVIRLVVKHSALCLPFGGYDDNFEPSAELPSIISYTYPAGDRDTFAFPLSANKYMTDVERKLARALYDERECNEFFPSDAVIELPDGTVFDFDSILAGE